MAAPVEHPEIVHAPEAPAAEARGMAQSRGPRGGRRRLALSLLALGAVAVASLIWASDTNTALSRTVAVGHFPWFSALIAPRGPFFVANSSDGTVSVLDTGTDGPPRTVTVGGQPGQNITGMVADARSGHVFVLTGDSVLTTLDDRGGAVVRTLHLNPLVNCSSGLAVDGRTARVFVGDCGTGGVWVIDAHSGRLLASTTIVGEPREIAVDEQSRRVFVVLADGRMSMLDAASGRLLRTFALGTNLCLLCTPPLPDGPMFATDEGNGVPARLYVLDAASGRLLRTIPLGMDSYDRAVDPATGQIVLVGGPVGAALTAAPFSGPGRLVILDGRTGQVLRRLNLRGMPGAVGVDARRHRLLLGMIGPVDWAGQPSGMGSVEVLDERSLRVLRSVPAGIIPWTITVDPHTDQAFVINANIAISSNWNTYLPTHMRPPEGWWQAMERSVKRVLPWLPLHPGAPPVAPANGTVTILNLARL